MNTAFYRASDEPLRRHVPQERRRCPAGVLETFSVKTAVYSSLLVLWLVATPVEARTDPAVVTDFTVMVGRDVYSANGERVGRFEGVVRSQADQKHFLVVEHGGMLGMGAERAAVPIDQAEMRGERIVILSAAQEGGLDRFTTYDPGVFEPVEAMVAEQSPD